MKIANTGERVNAWAGLHELIDGERRAVKVFFIKAEIRTIYAAILGGARFNLPSAQENNCLCMIGTLIRCLYLRSARKGFKGLGPPKNINNNAYLGIIELLWGCAQTAPGKAARPRKIQLNRDIRNLLAEYTSRRPGLQFHYSGTDFRSFREP